MNIKRNVVYIFLFLAYLRIILISKRIFKILEIKLMGSNRSPKKIFSQYLHNNISRIMPIGTFSEISIARIKRLRGTANSTYLIELELKNIHSNSSICIIAKCLELKGTYLRTTSFIKLYGMRVFSVRSIPTEEQRLMSEIVCTNKLNKIQIKAPEIIYVDWDRYFIFNDFVEGISIKDIIQQIKEKQVIENWQNIVLEEVGKGLAEMHSSLKITHGDTAPSNWILEKATGNLFLVDWETAGRGDPAWDIAHLIYEIASKFDNKKESIELFKKIFDAIIRGYEVVSQKKNITRCFLNYWYMHALTVSPLVHEIIFNFYGVPLTRGCRFLRWLQVYSIFKHYPENQKRPIFNKFTFNFFRAFISFYFTLTSISRKSGSNGVVTNTSCAFYN